MFGIVGFCKAGNGGMVKRLHMGRAAEGGVTAAYLAARGFEGPDVLLEGKFGYLDVYCARRRSAVVDRLDSATSWESLNIWFKMFPCHVTAQAPVRAIRQLQREHHFGPQDISKIVIETSEKVLSHHADRAPAGCWHGAIQRAFQCGVGAVSRSGRSPGIPRWPAAKSKDPWIYASGSNCVAILRPMAIGHNASCRLEVILADGRSVAITKTDFDDNDGGGKFGATHRTKVYATCLAAIPDDKQEMLLMRLKAIEQQENVAQIWPYDLIRKIDRPRLHLAFQTCGAHDFGPARNVVANVRRKLVRSDVERFITLLTQGIDRVVGMHGLARGIGKSATIGGGVPTGASRPSQRSKPKPGTPASVMVGTLGSRLDRLAPVAASGSELAGVDLPDGRRSDYESHGYAACDQISDRLRAAGIRHVHKLDAGLLLEQHAAEMRQAAGADRAIAKFARLRLGESDEVGNAMGTKRWIDCEKKRAGGELRDRRKILAHVERRRRRIDDLIGQS